MHLGAWQIDIITVSGLRPLFPLRLSISMFRIWQRVQRKQVAPYQSD